MVVCGVSASGEIQPRRRVILVMTLWNTGGAAMIEGYIRAVAVFAVIWFAIPIAIHLRTQHPPSLIVVFGAIGVIAVLLVLLEVDLSPLEPYLLGAGLGVSILVGAVAVMMAWDGFRGARPHTRRARPQPVEGKRKGKPKRKRTPAYPVKRKNDWLYYEDSRPR